MRTCPSPSPRMDFELFFELSWNISSKNINFVVFLDSEKPFDPLPLYKREITVSVWDCIRLREAWELWRCHAVYCLHQVYPLLSGVISWWQVRMKLEANSHNASHSSLFKGKFDNGLTLFTEFIFHACCVRYITTKITTWRGPGLAKTDNDGFYDMRNNVGR